MPYVRDQHLVEPLLADRLQLLLVLQQDALRRLVRDLARQGHLSVLQLLHDLLLLLLLQDPLFLRRQLSAARQ